MTALPFDDDELVSAYLDGEATPDEAALVESDPVLLARAEALRVAISLTAQPVAPPPAEAREAAIAAALAVAEEVLPRSAAAPPPPAPPPPPPSAPPPPLAPTSPSPVVDLAAARRRRANRTWLAAAAAIAVAALVVPLLLRSSDDKKSTVADRGDTSGQDGPDTSTPDGGGQPEALQGDLGEFVSWNALHRDISKQLREGADLSSDYDTPCPAPDDFTPETGGVASIGVNEPLEEATWFVGEDDDTGEQVILILDADCDQRVREVPED